MQTRDEQRTARARTRLATAQPEVRRAMGRVRDQLAGGEPFADLLVRQLDAAADEIERERNVLEAMLPSVEVMTGAATTQLLWNANARAEALREFGALTSAQIAELRGVTTTNPHTTPSRWVADGRVFAIERPTGRVFPAFQFQEGEPRPVIAGVLAALAGQLKGWEVLAWFTGSSGHLGGARPVDLLGSDPDGVVAAAAYQAALSED